MSFFFRSGRREKCGPISGTEDGTTLAFFRVGSICPTWMTMLPSACAVPARTICNSWRGLPPNTVTHSSSAPGAISAVIHFLQVCAMPRTWYRTSGNRSHAAVVQDAASRARETYSPCYGDALGTRRPRWRDTSFTAAKRDLRRQTSLDAVRRVADVSLDSARIAECKDILEKCLNRLTSEERFVFELRCLEKRGISEIARRRHTDPRDVS